MGRKYASTSSFCMQSLGAIHIACMGLERELPSRNTKRATRSVSRRRCCIDTSSFNARCDMCRGERVRALVILYNGRSTETLDSLRHQRFREKVASCATQVHPQTLPPTSGAAKYHSMHVYLQVQELNASADGLLPAKWGGVAAV